MPPRQTLTRDAWTGAAIRVLEQRGIASVKIEAVAKQLKVTRGSFYFHFEGLRDLHEALLEEWRASNCRPFEALGQSEADDGETYFAAVVKIWVDENPFSPSLDLAVRDWSRTLRPLSTEVAANDTLRISLLVRAFRAMGYSDDESLVRARISYFHQIGYYALPFRETASDRKRYQPIYGKVLVGPLGRGWER